MSNPDDDPEPAYQLSNHILRRALLRAMRAPAGKVTPHTGGLKDIEKLLSGEWSAVDLIESVVDHRSTLKETSTSASVGAGPDKYLGSDSSYHDAEFDDLFHGAIRFIKTRRRMGEDLDTVVARFFQTASVSSPSIRKRLILTLRRRLIQ